MFEKVDLKIKSLSDNDLTIMILNYINETIYNYAILIDGQWGTGKTYYIKEKLLEEIEKNEKNKLEEREKYRKKKPIYLSLYGVKNVSEISGQLYINIMKESLIEKDKIPKVIEKATAAGKVLNDIAMVFGKGVDMKSENMSEMFEKFIDIKKYILIFDDLERCECDINEVLGYINNFVEHDGVKVIIVANEAEIGKRNISKNLELKYLLALDSNLVFEEMNKNRQEEKANITLEELKNRTNFLFEKNIIYDEIKEKLIGITIKYDPDISDVLENMIISKFDIDGLRAHLMRKIPEYINYMGKMNHKNLRTFQFFLTKASQLFKQIKISKYNAKDFVIDSLLENCFKVSIQYKNGEYIDTWDKFEEYGYKFIDKKNRYDCVFVFRFMDDFIINNVLDVSKAEFVLDECHAEYIESQKNPDAPLNKLEGCWFLISEREVLDLIPQVMEALRNNEYSKKTYSRIIRIFIELDSIGFEHKYLNEAMSLMINNIEETDKYEYIDNTIIISEKDKNFNKKFKELFNIIQGKMELKKEVIEKVKVEKFFINSDWIEKLLDYVDENINTTLFNEGFLSSFNNSLLNDKLINPTPKDLMALRQMIYTLYYKSCYSEEIFTRDIDRLKELVKYLNEMDYNEYDKIQKMQFNYLKNELVEVLDKYKK